MDEYLRSSWSASMRNFLFSQGNLETCIKACGSFSFDIEFLLLNNRRRKMRLLIIFALLSAASAAYFISPCCAYSQFECVARICVIFVFIFLDVRPPPPTRCVEARSSNHQSIFIPGFCRRIVIPAPERCAPPPTKRISYRHSNRGELISFVKSFYPSL